MFDHIGKEKQDFQFLASQNFKRCWGFQKLEAHK